MAGNGRIAHTEFVNNRSFGVSGSPGALRLTFPGFRVEDSVFAGNSSQSDAGAARGGEYLRCTFTANTGPFGGALVEPRLISATSFLSNLSTSFATGGGAVYTSALLVRDSLFAGNIAFNDGGAIYQTGASSGYAINCSLADNIAVYRGGALFSSGPVHLRNSIVWANAAGVGPQLATAGELRVAFSDVMGGIEAIDTSAAGRVVWGLGNIDLDPRFVNPDDGYYSLELTSPCIDAGENGIVLTENDLAGRTRRQDIATIPDTGLGEAPIVDLGALEVDAASGNPPCPGDADDDGEVDLSDLTALLSNFGSSGDVEFGDGDFDDDDDVDLSDLTMLLSQFGAVCP